MKRKILPCILLALVAALNLASQPAAAQEQPMLVVSLSGVDEILGDVQFIMELAGNAPLGQIAAMTATPYTQGIDTARPVGIVVTANGPEIQALGMIPVKDLNKFLKSIEPQIGPADDVGGGIRVVNGPSKVYIKESNGWAFVSNSESNLGSLPANPLTALNGMDKQYDIGVRAIVKNVPPALKAQAIAQIRQGVEAKMNESGDADEIETQKQVLEAQIKQWESMLNETDEIVVGWQIDREKQSTHIDISQSAVAGSPTAESLSKLSSVTTRFAGFAVEDAAIRTNMTNELGAADIERTISMLGPTRDSVMKEIDEDDDLPDAKSKATAKSVVNKLFDVVEATVRGGKLDGAASLTLDNNTLSLISGMQVADGKKVEEALDELLELAKDEPKFPAVRKNASKAGNVNIHTMTIPVPADEEDARDVFGEELDVAVGIGPDSVYLGFGENCLSKIQSAIQGSTGANATSPFALNLAMSRILAFASHFDDNPAVAAIAESLKANQGSDNVVVSSKAIPNGVSYRLEIQEGVVKSVGAVTGAQPAGA
ncbi:MAG: hypothetical protein KDA60_22195, partial [Planctomycetales bacterium]|nr:hypothetical protein [Planctomycetales bacterium]